MYKTYKISISVIAVLVLIVGGIFAFTKINKKRNVSISPTVQQQSVQTLEQSEQQSIVEEQQENSMGDQQVVDDQQSVAQQENTEQQKTTGESKEENKTQSQSVEKKTVETQIQKPAEKNTDSKTSGKIVEKFVSWGFQKADSRNIKAIIVHTTYNALGGDPFDFDKVMQEWKDAGVAPHYAIDRDGKIYQLVADKNIAWHAGASQLPDGTTDVNGVSIGIEIVNDKTSKFTDAQYLALNQLIKILKDKYSIKYILGHDEIAPGRKTDPWGIEWSKVNR